jgi:virginiamycin B lyase
MTAIVALAAASTVASASVLTGTVRDPAGKPTANVFVTAQNDARKMAVSVLTDPKGHYTIDDLAPGIYQVRARKAGFTDGIVGDVKLGAAGGNTDLELSPDDDLHLNTPGAAWLNALPVEPMKATFVSSCTICHDAASPIGHRPRDAAGWEAIIHQMRTQADAYSVIVPLEPAKLAGWLAKNEYGTKAAPFDPFAKSKNVVTTARISEYQVGDVTSWMHDMAVDPATGIAWVGDYVRDELVSVDPRSGEQTVYPSPIKGTGMHTLHFDREDGSLWITLQLVQMVANFNTRTKTWRLYSGFTPGSLNHSFANDSEGFEQKDKDGRLYIGTWGGNRTAMLDPKTGKVTEKQLPGAPTDKPYGIAVNSKGVVWYTKYSDNKMGYYDPSTGETKEWQMDRPDSAPHRMHIDNKDNLWIPLSGYGTVLRYNTIDGTKREYALPDKDTYPYVLRYDGPSNRVWITGNGGNAIYALDPDTGKFTTFRMPSNYSYGRMVAVDPATGNVWTALASYPNKLSLRDHSMLDCIHHATSYVK